MTSNLPPNLLKLFEARPPLPPAKSLPKDYGDIQLPQIDPIASYLAKVQEDNMNDQHTAAGTEERIDPAEFKKQRYQESMERQQQEYNPLSEDFSNDPKKTSDAFKTVFVGRLPLAVRDEDRLRDIFSHYAAIVKIIIPRDPKGRPRPFAFVELEDERDLRSFIRECNGMRMENRRILVDVERGRTVPGWQPMRIREDKKVSVLRPLVVESAPVQKRSRSRSRSPMISPPPVPPEPAVHAPVKTWHDTRELRRY